MAQHTGLIQSATNPGTGLLAGGTYPMLDLTGRYGSVKVWDSSGNVCEFTVSGTGALPTTFAMNFNNLLGPFLMGLTGLGLAQVGFALSGSVLQAKVGASSTITWLYWKYEGPTA